VHELAHPRDLAGSTRLATIVLFWWVRRQLRRAPMHAQARANAAARRVRSATAACREPCPARPAG
jgi:hypothetical protein